eukprot:2154654-Prymnesium_polylepis.3
MKEGQHPDRASQLPLHGWVTPCSDPYVEAQASQPLAQQIEPFSPSRPCKQSVTRLFAAGALATLAASPGCARLAAVPSGIIETLGHLRSTSQRRAVADDARRDTRVTSAAAVVPGAPRVGGLTVGGLLLGRRCVGAAVADGRCCFVGATMRPCAS